MFIDILNCLDKVTDHILFQASQSVAQSPIRYVQFYITGNVIRINEMSDYRYVFYVNGVLRSLTSYTFTRIVDGEYRTLNMKNLSSIFDVKVLSSHEASQYTTRYDIRHTILPDLHGDGLCFYCVQRGDFEDNKYFLKVDIKFQPLADKE